MIVIDSSALIAILRREPEADSFLQIIASADGCLLSSVSLLETSMVLAGRSGDVGNWAGLDALITRAVIQVVTQDAGLADAARRAFLLASTSVTARPTLYPRNATFPSCLKVTIFLQLIC